MANMVWARLLSFLLFASGLGVACLAQVEPTPRPAPPSDVVAAKAYSTLERYCADCHRPGSTQGGTPDGIGDILALGDIARDASLVKPGLPDASLIYNVALTHERHLDIFNDPALSLPTAQEIQALREWIAELPAAAACGPHNRPDMAAQRKTISDALGRLDPERAGTTRFLSLAHLAAECTPPAEMQRFIGELESGAFLSRRGAGPEPDKIFQPIDPQSLTWKFSLRDLGWSPADWEAVTSSSGLAKPPAMPEAVVAATGSSNVIVPADWLAYALYISGRASGGQRPALASNWLRGGTLQRLAAELWVGTDTLAQRLASPPSQLQIATHRLLAGDVLDRAELEALTNFLSGRPPRISAASGPLRIGLWADKRTYRAGDTAVFYVGTNRDCFLTLINVDRAGRATVLFPNELQPDNRIAAGATVQVPGPAAAYRFRFKDAGREKIVAICSQTHKAPEGVAHDFERLRFTVLGDWQLFLREPPEMKEARRDDAATDVPRPQPRQRRSRGAAPKVEPAGFTADIQTRTAIAIDIR